MMPYLRLFNLLYFKIEKKIFKCIVRFNVDVKGLIRNGSICFFI